MLLTEREVANRLRRSLNAITRLRLSGKLAYIPGRPVLIDEADLAAYIERIRVERRPRFGGRTPDPTATPQEQLEDARAWALQAKITQRVRRRPST